MHMDPVSKLIQEIAIDPGGDQIPGGIIGFGETESGELLIAVTEWNFNSTGRIIAIVDGVAPGLDRDNDTIDDDFDNCLEIANGPNNTGTAGPSQNDNDSDGYGNMCDGDLDNNLAVNFSDLFLFKAVFNTADPDADLDGNMAVNFSDLFIFKNLFNQPPGPSETAP